VWALSVELPARGWAVASVKNEWKMVFSFAPEAQCTPSRTALLTGRHAIRTGNHTVATSGAESGIVAWERTLGDLFSGAGYATMCMGKWHIGDCDGRWPNDHGFDEWYGPPHSYRLMSEFVFCPHSVRLAPRSSQEGVRKWRHNANQSAHRADQH
jgi:arylsulfatase A-like enzyme